MAEVVAISAPMLPVMDLGSAARPPPKIRKYINVTTKLNSLSSPTKAKESEKVVSKQKAAAVSQIERDRIAREKAEKVRRFIAERDRLRPLAPNYLSAFKATIDLNPITRLDEMTLARQKRERMRLAQLEEKPSKPPPRVRRPILPKSKVVEVGSSSSSEVVAGDVQIIPPWPYRNSPSPAAGSSSSAQRSGDPTTAGRNSPADGPNSPSAGSPAKVRDVKVGVLGVIDETEVQTKLKLRKKLRKKKKELAKKGPTLLSPRQLDGEGMAEKVEAMLQKTIGDGLALLEAPINEKMDAGFDEVARAIKIHEGERRWAEWPFGNRGEKPVARHGSLPPRMKHAPWATDITYHSVALAWDFVKDVGGYECEVADINALEGQQEWRKVYKGPKQECIVRKLGREIEGIRVRVRTFNGIGKSEWSPRSELIKLAPLPAPINREIEEIPGTWLTIDTAGIPELSAKDVNAALLNMVKQDLIKALHANRTVIKVAFRYYALAGVTNVDDDPSTMTMVQFSNFCVGAKIIGKDVSTSDCDRVFLRAVRTIPSSETPEEREASSLATALEHSGVKVSGWKKAKLAVNAVGKLLKGAQLMNQPQFVQALIRLTAFVYPNSDEMTIAEKLTRLCKWRIEGHVFSELQLIEDELTSYMRTRAMSACLERRGKALRTLFETYAAADKTSADARRQLATMNVLECNELCCDVELFDDSFAAREMLMAFVRVNISDDLYYQDDQFDTSTGAEVDYGEFEEWLARMFHGAVWNRTQQMAFTANVLDQDGDGDLDADDADDLFDECDEDGSGTITTIELENVLAKRLNETAAKIVAKQMIELADKDKTGDVTREELQEAIKVMMSGAEMKKEQAEKFPRGFADWLDDVLLPRAVFACKKKRYLLKGDYVKSRGEIM